MLKNYFKIAIRNILKHKFFAAINMIGLVIGMTCCLLIFVYIKDEMSFDRFHTQADNLYRIGLHGKVGGQEMQTVSSNTNLAQAMQAEIPGVEHALRIDDRAPTVLRFEDKAFTEPNMLAVDSNFFQFFSFKLLEGDIATALKEPSSIVFTPRAAAKYFGSANEAMGKTVQFGNDNRAFKVTGLCDEPPNNSHIQYDILVSWSSFPDLDEGGWTSNSYYTYIIKSPATTVESINAKLEDMVAKNVGPEIESGLGISFDKFREQGGIYSYYIFPMVDSHLQTNHMDNDMQPKGDIRYVYIFGAVGAFILLIACINFMNLATARSAGRAKEVGLRKAMGSERNQMIIQFLSESFLYSFAAIIISLVLSYMFLPWFNLLAGKELTLNALQEPTFMFAAFALVVLVGFLAVSYPAFYLTSFNAVEVLKGKVRAGMKSKGVRSTLVVVQFAVSTFLIVATVVVFQQLSFLQSKDLGLDQHKIINISNTAKLETNRAAFKNQVLALSTVEQASYTNNTFPGVNNTTIFREKGTEADKIMGKYYADWDHLATMKFTLAEGRFFSKEFPTDSSACIINQAAVKEFGWETGMEKEVLDYNGPVPETMKVIGVVKDFNFESLKDKVRPMVIRLTEADRNLLIRYKGDPQAVVASLDNLWKQNMPDQPFEYTFLDEDFDALFRSEMRLRDIFIVFSSVAILIACMGLFALAAFTTEQRTKEIGIRKALGATPMGLTLLLSREFTRLVLIAIVPALVLGWYITNEWLNDFAYRISISPLLFLGSAAVAIAIAWVTVGYQAIKAAQSNPVNSLRYE
jgi:putative ABC transport system permease protein